MFTEFTNAIEAWQEAQCAISFVKANCIGRAWLIGGATYRTLINSTGGKAEKPKDLDFLVEDLRPVIKMPSGWSLSSNSYGNPKIKSHNTHVEIIPIYKVRAIEAKGYPHTFDSFLLITPLTVQSIGYEIFDRFLEGEVGLDAVRSRTVRVNNQENANFEANKRRISLSQYVEGVASSIGFTPIV